jgi:hypothetical protein
MVRILPQPKYDMGVVKNSQKYRVKPWTLYSNKSLSAFLFNFLSVPQLPFSTFTQAPSIAI